MEIDLSALISRYELQPHKEGGYFKRIFTSTLRYGEQSNRKMASSIYYLLTAENNIGHLHCSKSDILHYFLEGDSLNYYVLCENDGLKEYTLSNQHRFLHVAGGKWKASHLQKGTYALIAEVVLPEFSFDEWAIARREEIKKAFPAYFDKIAPYILKETST